MSLQAANGQMGEYRRVPRTWVGWSGQKAHPNAPMGGGGPGFFRAGGGPLGREIDTVVPGGPLTDLDEGSAPEEEQPVEPNPPPATVARTLTTKVSVQNDFVDIEIDSKVLADGTGGGANSAHTHFEMPKIDEADLEASDDKKTLKSAKKKLKWRGSITIQTVYGSGAAADGLSCYGRGTTKDDRKKGDITLGFHESCHIAHMVGYLDSHPLPSVPELKVGMSYDDAKKKAKKYFDDVLKYAVDLNTETEKLVDEVGHKLSEVESKGCYMHILPPEEDEGE